MNINITMKDCNFIVKPESRKVICVFYPPRLKYVVQDYLDELPGRLSLSSGLCRKYDSLRMPSYFKGVATCAPEDEWNEELGKLVAFNKMKKKFCSAFFRRINLFFNDVDQQIEQAIVTCDLMGEKWNKQITNTDEKIKAYFK